MSPGYAAKSQQKIVPARTSGHYDVQPLSPAPATLACGYTSERVTRPTRNCGTQVPGRVLFRGADGLGSLAQRVRPVDDRCDLPGLDKLAQHGQIGFVL